MTATLIIAGITAVCMLISVLKKPYVRVGKLNIGLYWIITLIGAIALLISGGISPAEAWAKITENTAVSPLKILTLFISMTVLSVFLGEAGFFDYVAERVFDRTGKGGIKLFFFLYITVSVLTVFTSNDVVILTFTPPVCIFAAKAKISPIPYLFGEFVAANTWSLALIVGNPTNVYLATGAGITFSQYFCIFALPALFCGLVSFGVLLLIFGKQLKNGSGEKVLLSRERTPLNKPLLIAALSHLAVCIIMLAVSDLIDVEMWLICLALALSLTVFNLIYSLIKKQSLLSLGRVYKKAPYELIPFILSMFIIVSALYKCGIPEKISSAVFSGNISDCFVSAYLSAGCANLLNNIPMSVLFSQVAAGNPYALFGAVIGSNIGAFITPVGALAGIMWNKILSAHGYRFSFARFCLYGVLTAVPTLCAACLGLLIVL